jgi:gluconate 5-dehydrogenase
MINMEQGIKMFSLQGMNALVTGGTHGIGLAIAAGMARCGASVAICARKQENLQTALSVLSSDGISAHAYVCDVTQEAAVERMLRDMRSDMGEADIVVNNAAIIKRIPALEMTAEQWREVIDTDLTSPFLVSRCAAAGMKKRGYGKIINMCSMMSEVGRNTVSAYAAAKGGLKMLTRALATEWAASGINVNAIGPGYIATEQTAPLRVAGHPFNEFIIKRTPAMRWGSVEDVVGGAVFLASHASDFVNGHVLYIDGGILASLGKATNEQ